MATRLEQSAIFFKNRNRFHVTLRIVNPEVLFK